MQKLTDRQRERMRKYYEQQLRALGAPPRKSSSPAVVAQRRRVWQHNSFLGYCKLAKKNLQTIISSTSVSPQAKQEAESILCALARLHEALKERID
jgi:hypothetical protein